MCRNMRAYLFPLIALCYAVEQPLAAELIRITPENYKLVVPAGKEVDAIYGDWILRNKDVVAVIAQPVEGRKANMTVRGVAGMLIDFTRRYNGSDQLSCFYPAAGRYLFEADDQISCQADGTEIDLSDVDNVTAEQIRLTFRGKPVADDGTTAKVSYTLRESQDWLEYEVELSNATDQPVGLPVEDSLRCDGNLFVMASNADLGIFTATDQYFGQCYAFGSTTGGIRGDGTGRNLRLVPTGESADPIVPPHGTQSWSGMVFCTQGQPGAASWARALENDGRRQSMQLKLQSPQGPVPHAKVEFFHEGASLGQIQSNDAGLVFTELLPGKYTAVINSLGRATREHEFAIDDAAHADSLSLPPAARVRARVVDGDGQAIAAKVQFVGLEDTPNPDFGPDSAVSAIKNVVYSAHGQFEQPIDAGMYQVIISHGPEYDADMQRIEVQMGQLVEVQSRLPRTVDTTGWISADFHSHSSPSGDNVSEQRGRVLNLLAENIEFAPCTEHNRIDTYEDDLLALQATAAMATCTGMELTGTPLPINHQNAFPLHRHEHEQDGGGPQTDADPVKQIERLALWDNSAAKVVQTNHPNIPQILGDKDLDGKADGGFRGMLGWMDVIEIHPLERAFTPLAADVSPEDKYSNRVFCWMQLLNLGYRIPGVVNTDAHYNFHGSGWLRNYLQSSSDQPPHISIDEMIHSSEHGHLTMTTGPFLEAEVRVGRGVTARRFISGDDVALGGTPAQLWIRVQCPNWFDINRVQVFANGRPLDAMNFTRKTHPQAFRDGHVRFEHEIQLPKFERDTHVIVATIGEGLELGPVMGEERGKLPPVALTNPIFLDIDGSGFQANGDDLGVPFMLTE